MLWDEIEQLVGVTAADNAANDDAAECRIQFWTINVYMNR